MDPNNADAYFEWALLLPPSEKRGGEMLVKAAENDPMNPFAVQYAKLHGDAGRIEALVRAARSRAEENAKEQKQEKAKNERAQFLQETEASVRDALVNLPLTEEAELRAKIGEIASAWQVYSSRTIEGDIDSVVHSLMNCFQADTEGKPTAFVTVRTDSDGWGHTSHNVFVQCGRGMHHVGRFGDKKYLGVLHARF